MDFAFTDAELAFAAEARAWLGANLPPAWRRDHSWTRADDAAWLDVARDWQRMLFEGGWAAIAWPRAHGGRGATVIERWLFDQELDAVGAPRPAASSSVDLIGPAILHHGTAFQTDVGMSGPYDSVIGVEAELAIRRLRTGMPVRFHPAEGGVRIEGVIVDCDPDGRATACEPLRVSVP